MKAKPVSLSLYFGIPGAGKSTYAAYLAKKDMKKGRKVWSNFGITGAMKCEKSDFGKFMLSDVLSLMKPVWNMITVKWL